MKVIPIYETDRTRIVTRESCERKRYLGFEFEIEGQMVGLQRREQSLPLLDGIEAHDAAARVLAHAAGLGGAPIDEVVEWMKENYLHQVMAKGVHGEADLEQLVTEQTALLEGLLRGFLKVWVPRILEEYDVVSIEKPMVWNLAPGLIQRLRFDVVLRRKGDNQLVILDYKFIGYLGDAWGKKLEHSRQTSLYISAAEEMFGEPVEMAYLAMVKGSRRKDTAKSSPFNNQIIQYSPFLYAYALRGDVGNIYQTEYTNKKGYTKIRTYDEMPMAEWVDEHLWKEERNVLNEQFSFNPPIAPTLSERRRVRELVAREELDHYRKIERYRAMKKKAEEANSDHLRNQAQDYLDFIAAPMREEQCFMYGEQNVCPMYGICHNEGALENVLEDGAFEPRVPHHSTELEEAA